MVVQILAVLALAVLAIGVVVGGAMYLRGEEADPTSSRKKSDVEKALEASARLNAESWRAAQELREMRDQKSSR